MTKNNHKHSTPEQIKLCEEFKQRVENKKVNKKSLLTKLKEFITKNIIKQ